MIAEPLEKGLAEDIENEKVLITWNKWVQLNRGHAVTWTAKASFVFEDGKIV